jgi:hypothetical protein
MFCVYPLLISEPLYATPASGRVLTIKTSQETSLADLITSSGYSLDDKDIEEFLKDFVGLNKDLKGFNVIPKGTLVKLPLGKLAASGSKPALRGEREATKGKGEEPSRKQQEKEVRTRYKERKMEEPRREQREKEVRPHYKERKMDAALVLKNMRTLLFALTDVRAVTSDGVRVLSSSGNTEISLDTSSFPLMKLADERVILLDYRGILPEEVKDIIELSWPEYRVFSNHGNRDLKGSVSDLLDTLGYTSYRNGRITVGGIPRVDILPDIVTTRVSSDLMDTEIIAVNIVKRDEFGVPPEMSEWLRGKGVRIIELFQSNSPLSRPRAKTVSLSDLDVRTFSERFLNLLGFSVMKGDSLRISDRKEYALRIRTDMTVKLKNQKGTKAIRFSETPEAYLAYAKKHGVALLSLDQHAGKDEVLRKMMDFFSLEYLERPERTTAYITPRKTKYRISMPGFLVKSRKGPFFFTATAIDKDLYRFLMNERVTLVQF